jgi:hypothetical protein
VIDGCYFCADYVYLAVMLHDGWRKHRLYALRFGEHAGMLTAFGTLTGLHATPPGPGERVIAVTPEESVPFPNQSTEN